MCSVEFVVDLLTAPDILEQNQREFGYVYDARRGCITRLHKLFSLVPMFKFAFFHTSWCKNSKDSRLLFHCHVDYVDTYEFRLH